MVRSLGPKGARLFPQHVVGWHRARSKPESMELASDCAALIANEASLHYGLNGHYTVSYAGGWVRRVTMYLSPAPELSENTSWGFHKIILTSSEDPDGETRTRISHVDPSTGGGLAANEILKPKLLENILKEIYALTKDIPSGLLRRKK